MKKSFKFMVMALIIAIFASPVFGGAVSADAGNIELANGSYSVKANFLQTNNDEVSRMGNYLEDSILLNVVDGKVEATVTIKSNETVTLLQLDGKDAVNSVVDGEKRSDTFVFENLTSLIDAYVEYQVPMGNGKIHEGTSGFRIALDAASIETVEESGAEVLQLADGSYIIDAAYIRSDNEETSTMGSHLGDTIFLTVVNGKVEATVTINKDETVTLLQLDGKDAVKSVVDGEKRYDTFEMDAVLPLMNAYVEYQVMMGNGQPHVGSAGFRILLNESDAKTADPSDNPGAVVEKENTSEPTNLLTPDKAFEIDYIIKHATEDRASAGDQFFVKPAILLEKDGEKYIQLTINGSEYIDGLKTANGDMVLVKKNEDGSIVVQFKLDGEVSDVMEIEMMISVPGVYEGMHHVGRLFLDDSSVVEVDASLFQLAANKGDTVNPGDTEASGSSDENTKTDQVKNPQTGENANLLLLVMLLIGSGLSLALMMKRRFAQN